MKMQIAVENYKQIARVDRCAVLSLEFRELIEIAFGDGERKNAHRHHLEFLAHRIDLPHFLRREIAHNGAAVRNTPDDSLLLQFEQGQAQDRKSTRLNSSHTVISYAVFCLKKKKSPSSIS